MIIVDFKKCVLKDPSNQCFFVLLTIIYNSFTEKQ